MLRLSVRLAEYRDRTAEFIVRTVRYNRTNQASLTYSRSWLPIHVPATTQIDSSASGSANSTKANPATPNTASLARCPSAWQAAFVPISA